MPQDTKPLRLSPAIQRAFRLAQARDLFLGVAVWAFAGCGPSIPARSSALPAHGPARSSVTSPPQAAPSIAARMPRPGQARGAAAVSANDACEACHPEVAAQWRASLHRQSDVDPAYRMAFGIEPMPFCQTCHAPEADPARKASAQESALGVGCVTCHLDGTSILAGPLAPDRPSLPAPHAVLRTSAFGGSGACAGCHEFDFPDAVLRGGHLRMQSTVSEHAGSPQASVSCAGCHMRRDASGRRTHDVSVAGSPAMVRSAVTVKAQRVGDGRIRIELTPATMGHAFPTGDLFRRVELTAEALGEDQIVLARDVRYLARHFRRTQRKSGLAMAVLVADDRVGPDSDPRVVELDLGTVAKGRPIAWRVAYQRVEHPVTFDTDDAEVADEVSLGEGIMPVVELQSRKESR